MKTLTMAALALLFTGSGSDAEAAVRARTQAAIQGLQRDIAASGARWTAGETSASEADAADLTGLSPDLPAGKTAPLPELKALPGQLDWRDYGGKNFVTAPKNQAKCGSCWAFAMTGALEAYVLRHTDAPGADLDLSEQVMLSCSGTGSCKGGVIKPTFLVEKGLPLESAYPYAAQNGSCSAAAAGWQKQTYKIADWGMVMGGSAKRLKAALNAYGPIVTSMLVFEDLKHYKGGIYSHVSGKYLGPHAVVLVGYNDAEEYFIVKNSWSEKWGEAGFFKIGYDAIYSRVFLGGLYSVAYYAQGEDKGEAQIPARVFSQAETLLK